MKIVQVTQSYHPRPGGVTEHVHHVAEELRARGHQVTVVTANFGDNDASDETDVVRIGRNVLVPINGAWVNMTVGTNLVHRMRDIFERLQPDIIHTHCPLAPTLPLVALNAAPPGACTVGTFHAAAAHSAAYRVFRRPLERFWRRIDVRIAVSNAACDLVSRHFPGDYTIVPNGVDTRRFTPGQEPVAALRDDAFNVLFVGRLDKRKGVKYLFTAVAQAAAMTTRRIRLIVVGDDGLRRLILPRLPASVELVFAGVVPNAALPRYFATGDIFVSPATGQESFGIVLLEAMASGLPVIGTAIPGYLTILRHEDNALVVPPRDVRSLRGAILRLMGDDALRWRVRSNGLSTARAYRWPMVVDRLEAVYRAAIAGNVESRPADSLHAQKA